MKNKKIIKSLIILLLALLFNIINYSNASNINDENKDKEPVISNSCLYKNEFYECIEANGLDKNLIKTGSVPTNRMIDDYICISSGNKRKILENIILDKRFKDIEKSMDLFLNKLALNKKYYFTKGSKNNEINGIDDITKVFGNYPAKGEVMGYNHGIFYYSFNYLCHKNGIFNDIMQCTGEIPIMDTIKSINSMNSTDTNNECMRLAETKLAIYENIAQNLLKINKGKVKEDNIDKYNKKLNKQYDDLFQMFIQNVDYIWAILNNWTSKTRKCFGG